MAGNSKRTIVQLESSAGTGYRYTVTKSRKNHPGRIEFKKFDNFAGQNRHLEDDASMVIFQVK